jgi:hemerythrin-like metal-binding protein
MDAFVWNESYVTGETVVDNEHRELVRIINWIIEHQNLAQEGKEIERVLAQLVDYAVNHFAHEEELMIESGCDPHFVQVHVNVHQDFARQVGKMREFPASQADIEYLLRFLSSWLAHHILGIDQSMARQIRKFARACPLPKPTRKNVSGYSTRARPACSTQ